MSSRHEADRYETRADRLIREAQERGEFDDLEGAGKPIPGAGKIDDPLWWVRSWVRRSRDAQRGA